MRLRHADRLAAGLERLGGTHAVLLDLSLPDSQGLETFRRLRDRAPEMPIVVLTGFDDETVAVQAVQEVAQDCLPKGRVDGHLLVWSLRYAIERKRAEERAQLLIREQAARAEAERLARERAAILGADCQRRADRGPDGPGGLHQPAYAPSPRPRGGHRLRRGEFVGYPLLGPDGRPLAPEDRPLARAALHGETVIDAELRARRADGSEVIALGSATTVVAEDGTRLGAVLTLHDVTAQRALERQKDEFHASVSHDLRTPLAGIKTWIGVVLANEPADTPEPLHRMFVNIDSAADRMGTLVADLLELARFQDGRVGLQYRSTDLRALAQRIAAAIEPLAHAHDQLVEVWLPAALPAANADPDRLEGALLNLLGNAQKYGRDAQYRDAGPGARCGCAERVHPLASHGRTPRPAARGTLHATRSTGYDHPDLEACRAGHPGEQRAHLIGRGFGMEVVAYDVREQPLLAEVPGFRYLSLDELLAQADIVSLHVPYFPATHHLISRERLARMKRASLLINTARGDLWIPRRCSWRWTRASWLARGST